jgi:PAS domain S-box-containing protein
MTSKSWPCDSDGLMVYPRIWSALRPPLVQGRRNGRMTDTFTSLPFEEIFKAAGASLWVEDFSQAMEAVEELRKDGVEDLAAHLAEKPWETARLGKLIRIVGVNDETVRLLEADSKDDLLSSLDEIFGRSFMPVLAGEIAAVAERQKFFRAEGPIRTMKGNVRNVLVRLTLLGDPPDVSRVLACGVDVTEHHGLENELRNANTFLDAIVENIPDMIFVKDAAELRFVLFNRAGEKLLGIPRDQMYKKNDYDFFPDDEADFFTTKDRQVFEGGETLDIGEEPIHTARGLRWLHTRKVPLFDAEGKPAFLLGISEDITELKETRAALEERTRELERSNKELERFAYVASHDLHEPLRTIHSFTDLLREEIGGDLSDNARSFMGFITSGAVRMRLLIDGLLQLSRVGRHTCSPESVDTGALLDEIEALLHSSIAEAGGRITREQLPEVRGDPRLLIQLFQNLLANALKFRGPSPPLIRVACEEEEALWRFSVSDNGIGFEPEYAEQIFGVFRRLHPTGTYDGAGIGLSICQRIAEAHGGDIWAESSPGEGSTFFFTLPKEPAP